MIRFRHEFKRLRQKSGITQDALARALGVSRSTVGNYEQGIREPDFEMLEKIADYFNVSMSVLLDDETEIELYLKEKNEKLYAIVQKLSRLDASDKMRVEERIDTLLESDKYK